MATTPTPLRAFTLTSVGLTTLCWLTALLAHLLHWPAPLRWPLFPPGSHFYDFVDYLDRFPYLHTTRFFGAGFGYPFTYFAPGVPLYSLFLRFGKLGGFALYLALVSLAITAGATLLARALRRRGLPHPSPFICLAVLTSFPIAFCIERGNLEIVLAAGIALGLWAFCTDRPLLAAVLWGVFGSVKLYPLALVALFLTHRQLRFAAVALLTAALTTLASLWWIGPTLPSAWAGIHQGTTAFFSLYTLTLKDNSWDHSLFALLKLPLLAHGIPLASALRLYLPLAGLLFAAAFFLRVRFLPLANQVLFLSLGMVLLPPTSFPYTLTELYGSFAVLTLAAIRIPPPRALTIAMALLAAILSPFNLASWQGHGLEGQESALLLLALLLLTLSRPLAAPTPFQPATPAAIGPTCAVPRPRPSATIPARAFAAAPCDQPPSQPGSCGTQPIPQTQPAPHTSTQIHPSSSPEIPNR